MRADNRMPRWCLAALAAIGDDYFRLGAEVKGCLILHLIILSDNGIFYLLFMRIKSWEIRELL